MMPFLTILWWLLCAHALADYALQPEVMARWKYPDAVVPPAAGAWWWWMTAHALVNGCAVGLVMQATRGWWCAGILEALHHGLTDYAKCRHSITANQDQMSHLVFKAVLALLATMTLGGRA